MKVNWSSLIASILAMLPQTISDVEAEHAGKTKAEKTQLVIDGVTAGATVAAELDPKNAETIGMVSTIAGGMLQAQQAPPVPAASNAAAPAAGSPAA